MLPRLIVLAGCLTVAAMTLPPLTTAYLERGPQPSANVAPRAVSAQPSTVGGREFVVQAGAGGHFTATLDMNGRPVSALIDTGASTVAINATTARRIGLSPAMLDYAIPVATANGTLKGAQVILKRIRIGPITVDNVEGMVLPDAALSTTLVGMSFLNRLSSYHVQDGVLKLRR